MHAVRGEGQPVLRQGRVRLGHLVAAALADDDGKHRRRRRRRKMEGVEAMHGDFLGG